MKKVTLINGDVAFPIDEIKIGGLEIDKIMKLQRLRESCGVYDGFRRYTPDKYSNNPMQLKQVE